MKFDDSLNEVIDMTKQNFAGSSWERARILWYKLSKKYEVYPSDHEGFISFEKFFKTFLEKHGEEPSMQDASEFLARSKFPHIR